MVLIGFGLFKGGERSEGGVREKTENTEDGDENSKIKK